MMGVSAPKGAQLLIFPMLDCTVSAGFRNKKYGKAYGYTHYGVDFDSKRAEDFDVIASGKGTVIGVEKNENSIGGVVIIRYDDVYNPTSKKVGSLVLRYLHLFSINVKKKQTVEAYDVIGTISGSDEWLNHIHVEIDTDTMYPRYTPQVREEASILLIQKGSRSDTILDPMKVFVVGKKQAAKVHSLAKYASKTADAPRYYEK